MKLYIAGPMTGFPDFNYPAFRSAAELLAALGHDVEDPSTNINPTPNDYHGWLRAGLAQLIRCEGVALLDGWEASGGARLEVNVAATLGMRVRPLNEWLTGTLAALNPAERRAPVQSARAGTTISWAEHEETWAGYARRFPTSARAQSAERIAERGGFGVSEVLEFTGHAARTLRDPADSGSADA
ncbi:DUF4406 domain-containing protein [Agromyces atrinae]|uniref:DUF4406 domain-containing protein n=1 Tax=Agromyces atrinae TaxID=592376 RepID=UPI001F59AD7C|nr:DUF4406 domain-containing protein [Agromyces atrinae]MCI2958193.1 DUF4406 domain-containing protein [Agromyces atrinae]